LLTLCRVVEDAGVDPENPRPRGGSFPPMQ